MFADIKRQLKNMDWVLLVLLGLVLVVNMIVLKSASGNIFPDNPYYYVKRQLLWTIVGLIAMFCVAFFDYRHFLKLYPLLYFVIVVLLVGVLFAPAQSNAHRWFDLKFMDFQPSELAKLVMIICFACFVVKRQDRINRPVVILQIIVCALIPFVLILIEPDLGTSIIFVAFLYAMAWVSGISRKLLIVGIIIIALLVGLIFGVMYVATDGYTRMPEKEDMPSWLPLEPYQAIRLVIFINPYMDPLDSGYHMIQSEVAIGSGGLWGKGYGQGSQVQGNFLPAHHTDFIFAVVGEELGFVGTSAILLLYLAMLLRALRVARKAVDRLGQMLVVGVVAMFVFQIFVNAGMSIGLMPITGLPFPFLSYGGSAMLVNLMCMGLVFNVAMRSNTNLF